MIYAYLTENMDAKDRRAFDRRLDPPAVQNREAQREILEAFNLANRSAGA